MLTSNRRLRRGTFDGRSAFARWSGRRARQRSAVPAKLAMPLTVSADAASDYEAVVRNAAGKNRKGAMGLGNFAPARSATQIATAIASAASRALTLTCDAIILTLAAPFFVVWWVVRAVRRYSSRK